MMQDKTIRAFGNLSIGMLVGVMVACAGGDTPPRTDKLEADLAAGYGDGPSAASGGTGGAAPSNGGSGGQAPDDTSGGTGGTADPGSGGTSIAEAGSAGSGSTEPPPPAECDGFAILKQKCGVVGCHGAGSMVSAFADTEAGAADFVDEDAQGGACLGEGPIYDTARPEDSLVIKKIDGSTPVVCGSAMPLGATAPFPADELECVKEWISTL